MRQQNIPTPEIAEVPFALTPPPVKPERLTLSKALKNELTSLFKDEEGSLYLKPPPPFGDRRGLRAWLTQQEKAFGGEPWFARVEGRRGRVGEVLREGLPARLAG